jgi:hypothetical protein
VIAALSLADLTDRALRAVTRRWEALLPVALHSDRHEGSFEADGGLGGQAPPSSCIAMPECQIFVK